MGTPARAASCQALQASRHVVQAVSCRCTLPCCRSPSQGGPTRSVCYLTSSCGQVTLTTRSAFLSSDEVRCASCETNARSCGRPKQEAGPRGGDGGSRVSFQYYLTAQAAAHTSCWPRAEACVFRIDFGRACKWLSVRPVAAGTSRPTLRADSTSQRLRSLKSIHCDILCYCHLTPAPQSLGTRTCGRPCARAGRD